MKLVFAFLAVLASVAALSDDMILDEQETHYTFEVQAENAPSPTADTNTLISVCLASSFNDIHDPAEYHIEAVDIETETVTPLTRISKLERWYNPYVIGSWGNLWSYRCNMCSLNMNAMLTATHNYPQWETAFCGCLQGTSDELLQTASDCHIERENGANQALLNASLRGAKSVE